MTPSLLFEIVLLIINSFIADDELCSVRKKPSWSTEAKFRILQKALRPYRTQDQDPPVAFK